MTIDSAAINKIVQELAKGWNSHSPDAVAAIYAEDARFVINRGQPMIGRADIAAMAAGFMSDFPDMTLQYDSVMTAGDHAMYTWTFKGHYKKTKNFVRFRGWEEWELGEDLKVASSLGWYDDADYQDQLSRGG